MTPYLFNQSPEHLRRIGARGGKARARNWRARRQAPLPARSQPAALVALTAPTTAQAIALLDAQCPWLRGAEKRIAPKPAPAKQPSC